MTTSKGRGQLLVACLREAGGSTPSDFLIDALESADLDALVNEAIVQRVGGALLAVLARTRHRDEPVVEKLRDVVRRELARHLFSTANAQQIGHALDDASVPHVWVKGPVLSEHVYPDPSWRSYSDVDLLVSSSDAMAARAVLSDMGGVVPGFQRGVWERGFDGEVAFFLPSGLNVDLHHELVNDSDVRPHFDVPVAEIIRRARRITLLGGSLAIPDPADQLLHLCLHAAVSNGRKLVWLLDIDQAIRRDPPDHDVLVRRAHRWKVGLPAAIMLERSRRVLHTPVSDQLLDDLAPKGLWRRWCHVILSARPPETAADAVLSGGVVVASTRESTVPSVAALVRAVWRDGVREPLRNENHPWRRLFAGGRRG